MFILGVTFSEFIQKGNVIIGIIWQYWVLRVGCLLCILLKQFVKLKPSNPMTPF